MDVRLKVALGGTVALALAQFGLFRFRFLTLHVRFVFRELFRVDRRGCRYDSSRFARWASLCDLVLVRLVAGSGIVLILFAVLGSVGVPSFGDVEIAFFGSLVV